MKKITTCLIFALITLNVNAKVEVTSASGSANVNTIIMGQYGEALVLELPLNLKYTFSNTESVNLKLQVYVNATDFLRSLLESSAKANRINTSVEKNTNVVNRKIAAITTNTISESIIQQSENAKNTGFSVAMIDDDIEKYVQKIAASEILPIWESDIRHFASSSDNMTKFGWYLRGNMKGVDGYPMNDAVIYVLKDADTDEILNVRENSAYTLMDALKSGKSVNNTGNGVINLSQYFAVNMPVRVHYFLIKDTNACTEYMDMEAVNGGFKGMYDSFQWECDDDAVVAYKRDVAITKGDYALTELDWDVTTPDGQPFKGTGEYIWVVIWEAVDTNGKTLPTLGTGMNLIAIFSKSVTIPTVKGQYTDTPRPYDVNGYFDEQCDKYPSYCTGIVGAGLAPAPKVAGYYNTLGQKLLQEPESGMYIIIYDNGKAEKVLK